MDKDSGARKFLSVQEQAVLEVTAAHYRQRIAEKQRGHGYTASVKETPTYISWQNMKQRCTNPNKDNYAYYGGRGIRVCDRWLDFENFLEDMGERPQGCELSRLDHDKNYEPGNVVWEPKEINIAERNVRNSRGYGLGVSARDAQKRTYTSWQSMLDRCRNPSFANYELYGGRGIKVCPQWLSFDVFLVDMGTRPEGKVLSRLNTDGDFEPSNCRWMTRKEQIANQRRDVGQPTVSHGMHKTPTYRVWSNMKHKCSEQYYKRECYFDVGITVCEAWQTFENFYADMGEQPTGMTLHRIDINGNFEPGNCRWRSGQQKATSRRR